MTEASNFGGPALRRLLDVVLRLGAERRTEPVLRDILDAARDLQFELAARLRDEIAELKKELRGMDAAGIR